MKAPLGQQLKLLKAIFVEHIADQINSSVAAEYFWGLLVSADKLKNELRACSDIVIQNHQGAVGKSIGGRFQLSLEPVKTFEFDHRDKVCLPIDVGDDITALTGELAAEINVCQGLVIKTAGGEPFFKFRVKLPSFLDQFWLGVEFDAFKKSDGAALSASSNRSSHFLIDAMGMIGSLKFLKSFSNLSSSVCMIVLKQVLLWKLPEG